MWQMFWFNGVNLELFEMELGVWRTRLRYNTGTASGMSRSRHNEIQSRIWTGSLVDCVDGTTSWLGHKPCPILGNRKNALLSYREQGLHWRSCAHVEKCAWGEMILSMEPRWTWGGCEELLSASLTAPSDVTVAPPACMYFPVKTSSGHPMTRSKQVRQGIASMLAALSIRERSLLVSHSNTWSCSSISTHCLWGVERKRQVSEQPHQKKKWSSGTSCRFSGSHARGIAKLLATDGDPLVPRVCGVRA